jgi:release factor glutamine methyltransferase
MGSEGGAHPDGEAAGVRWRELLAEAEAALAGRVPSPGVDARRIVEEASGFEGAALHAGLDQEASELGVARFDRMLARRVAGEPLQYVLGRWSFRHLDLFVDGRVLIPRPETEVVAGLALAELDRIRAGRHPDGSMVAVDLGTGSGAIGLSLAVERPWVEVWLTDRSIEALAVATANLTGIGRPATRVTVAQGSWFDALPPDLRGGVDVLVSNPPYVAVGEDLPAEVADWEPHEALIAGPSGLDDLTVLVAGAPVWLRPGGALVLEHAPDQGERLVRMALHAGFVEARTATDLVGRERALVARLRG